MRWQEHSMKDMASIWWVKPPQAISWFMHNLALNPDALQQASLASGRRLAPR